MNIAYGYELGTENPKHITFDEGKLPRSIYIVGSSQRGKSSLIEGLIAQDCHDDIGIAVFDAESRLTEPTLRHACDAKRETVLIDPTNREYVIPMNVLAVPPGTHPHSVIEGVLQ